MNVSDCEAHVQFWREAVVRAVIVGDVGLHERAVARLSEAQKRLVAARG